MSQALQFYEKKILADKEFPIQLVMNKSGNRERYFTMHWHEQIELHYVLRGRTRIRLEQEDALGGQGDLIICNSNILHEGFNEGVNGDPAMETMVVIFSMADFSRELADKNIIFRSLICQDPRIRSLMLQICREYEEKELGYRLACKGMLLQLVTYLVRHYAAEMLSERGGARRLERLERLNKVYQYIESHFTEPVTNKELAALVHVSQGRFEHLFKESAGMAPLQYVNEIRLEKAMNLLKKGGSTVTEVADAVGFSDYNHFGRLFKRRFACTPGEVEENSRIV